MCRLRNISISVFLALSWSSGIFWWTGGLHSFTTYSYAISRAGPLPRPVLSIPMKDMNGKPVTFKQWEGKYLLVDFMYLHCSSICGILRSRLYDYYPQLNDLLNNKLMLVSISFDPLRDTPEILGESWQSLGSRQAWKFAQFTGRREDIFEELYKFGVVVTPNRDGDFNHTAMHYLVNPEGKLIRIIDPKAGKEKVLAQIREAMARKI
ncbi:MAG: SCO family protein [Spirochaetia bacterium]|nr:SCO family protein [Spirochaetia bacterium]